MSAEELERGMVAAVLAAGRRVRELFRTAELGVRAKSGPGDLVTKADLEATEIALELIGRMFPGVAVVSEETGGEAGEGATFYLDPLDGTLNYVHGYPEFAVSLGLWEGGRPLAGVVYNPIADDLYRAAIGSGAFWNGRRIGCSRARALDECLLASGWPYDKTAAARNGIRMARLCRDAREVRVLGSASLALCHIASGTLDGYFEEGLASWDLAGGAAIAAQAGVSLSDLLGGPFSLEKGEVLASGSAIHSRLVEAVQQEEGPSPL